MKIPVLTARADDFSMKYVRFGGGPRTMVILPGLAIGHVTDSAEAVARSYEAMTGEFTVYLFDRREDPPSGYTVEAMAEDTAKAMLSIGLSGVYLFGASQGGMMAMTIAARHPGLVKKLALGSTAAKTSDGRAAAVKEWTEIARRGDGEELYLEFGRKLYTDEVFERYRDALAFMGRQVAARDLDRFVIFAGAADGFDITGELADIDCPVLLLSDSDDRVLGPDAAAEIESALGSRPDFESFTYSGFGHAAYDTAPDYRERLLAFFIK